MFVAASNFVWSVQEKPGDYFQHIRTRISENKGIVRRKKADYLLYLIIDAIIDNYYNAYEKLTLKLTDLKDLSKVKPNLDYAMQIEENKQNLFVLKKAISSLREAISKLEKIDLNGFESHYFSELKEQANFLIDDIDFDLQQLESSINLIFNMQNHKLNEVMKTLTILSAIFIPLTFLAGVYGMNFEIMPELKLHYGYFITLAVMLIIGISSFVYFKRKKWLE
jgi:magnesium transporter